MPFSAGVFTRIYNWVTDAGNAIPMTPSRFDQDANDMAAGLSNCVTRNGQSPPTANLPMGGFKLTGLAAGTTAGDSVNYAQLQSVQTTNNILQYGGIPGSADSTAILQIAINAISVGTKLIIPPGVWNFTNITFTSKTDFQLDVQGQLVCIATKPGGTAVDKRATDAGLQTIKFDTCSRFKITGNGSVQNGYREPLFFTTCTDFDVALDCRGNGTNDNLSGMYLRFCQRGHFGHMTLDGVTLKPTNNATEVYGNWTNNVQVWDSSDIVFDSGFTSRNSGMNGIYVGSNCTDIIVNGCILEYNAGSGAQYAWSSFGTFPTRWNFSNNIVRYNQADGLDVNNTQGSNADIFAAIHGNVFAYNGWINCNPANAAGVDGSGVGTFINVNRWSATNNQVSECASYVAYVSNCNNWSITDGAAIKSNTGTLNGGIYLTACTGGRVSGMDVKVPSTLPALVTQSMNDIVIRDNAFDGLLNFSNGTYPGCKFSENRCTAYSQVLVQFDFMDNTVSVTNSGQNGLFVANANCKVQRNKITATQQGIVNTSIGFTDITGNIVNSTTGEGIIVTASNNVIVRGNSSACAGNAAGIRLSGACTNCELSMNQAGSASANSFLVDAAATLTQKWANIAVSGAPSFGGTYGINF